MARNMKLSLKRLFARSMTGGFDLAGAPAPPRSPEQQTLLIALALVLALIGASAAAYYFAMQPVTLRIAVGPAGSDDLKVVQTLTQSFAQTHGYVRLKPVPTDGAVASANALADGKVDLAIIRGDLNVPKNAQAVATLRKNVAVIWVPPAKGRGKKSGAKITRIAQLAGHRIGVVGRTEANVNLLKLILQQYGVDPGKVEIVQFPAAEAAQAIRSQKADAYLAAGPVTARSPQRRSPHRARTAAIRRSSPSIRRKRSRRIIPPTSRRKFPPAPSVARPPGPTMT